jgi:hypothetical protein
VSSSSRFASRTNGMRRIVRAVLGAAALLSALVFQSPAGAQTSTTNAVALGVNLGMTVEPPAGQTLATLSAPSTVRTAIVVNNPGTAPLLNQQIVVRFGAKPDTITSVNDGTGSVGVVEPTTGTWFHTIAVIPGGNTITYLVTWTKACPGRWPLAVRVGDSRISQLFNWGGPADVRCSPDEGTSPQPPSFYSLPWPTLPPVGSTSVATFAPTTVVAVSSSVNPTNLPNPSTSAVPTTVGATTTVAPTTTIRPNVVTTTSHAPTTVANGVVPTPTLVRLPPPTSSTTPVVTAPKVTTTISSRPTTSVELFCKTIGGRRYCGPKSSTYKPGQAKAQELKPGQKPGATKKPTKKKKK